jgi:hypothetical protein
VARDASPTGVTTEGGRLVAEALAAALYDVAEALRTDAAEAPPQPARRGDGNRVGERAGRSLGSMSTRAMSEAAAAIAAAVVPAIVERIDVNALLAKVDVDALVSRIDVNRVLDTVDVDELVGRVDMAALAREALEGIDLGEIIQDSTASIATDTLEAIRIQAMRADGLLARIVDLPLRRRGRQTALAPRGRAR